jgi:hypothetical protein
VQKVEGERATPVQLWLRWTTWIAFFGLGFGLTSGVIFMARSGGREDFVDVLIRAATGFVGYAIVGVVVAGAGTIFCGALLRGREVWGIRTRLLDGAVGALVVGLGVGFLALASAAR